jgi:acyl-ACP thioesterase
MKKKTINNKFIEEDLLKKYGEEKSEDIVLVRVYVPRYLRNKIVKRYDVGRYIIDFNKEMNDYLDKEFK